MAKLENFTILVQIIILIILEICKYLIKIARESKIDIGKNVKIKFVKDRPGHDFRYALNSKKIFNKDWVGNQKSNFKHGLEKTFMWYLTNSDKYYKSISIKQI